KSALAANLVQRATESLRVSVQLQRLGQPPSERARHPSLGDQPIELGTGAGRRTELRNRPVAAGHDKPLAAFHATQIDAQILSQLCDSDPLSAAHVHQGSI